MLQLVYLSAAAQSFDARSLAALLAKTRANNARADVTGLLLYHEGSFLQVLEGPDATVDALYTKVATDPRHTRIHVVSRIPIAERQFGGWSMGFFEISSGVIGSQGFSDFLRSGALTDFSGDEGRLGRLLAGFREGRWRQGGTL